MLARMRLVFGPDDDAGFTSARDLLLERFERWLADEPRLGEADATGMASDAGLAMDWKWSYGDGDLGRWRTADVGEFLLEWCPRKLTASPSDCESLPSALVAFTAFLDAEGMLASGSASSDALAEAAASMRAEFLAAMGDASNFGLAKSLFSSASADGVDLGDVEGLGEWIAEFNARPEDDRRRIIPDTALTVPRRPALPPVAMPDDTEIALSKSKAPILAMFAAFAEYVSQGRGLHRRGCPTRFRSKHPASRLPCGPEVRSIRESRGSFVPLHSPRRRAHHEDGGSAGRYRRLHRGSVSNHHR